MPRIVRCRVDHTAGNNPRSIELLEPAGQLVGWAPSDILPLLDDVETAARRGLYVAGFVAYEAAPAFDAALTVQAKPSSDGPANLPLAWFGLFAMSRPATPLSRLAPPRPEGEAWSCEIEASEHAAAVDDIRTAIGAGDTYLVNYTTRFRRHLTPTEDPFTLYQQLVAGHTGGYHAYLETTDWAVACGSPELFFELNANHLTMRPMKGTAARGRWTQEDLRRAEQLESSPKERAENVMVVDLLRNDIGRIAVPGTVAVPQLWQLERHPTVWQLTSTVTATMRSGTTLPDIFEALFPSGSVTGAPKVSSMATIAQLERSPRGVYCGAVGIVQPRSSRDATVRAQFAVAIRTAVVDKVSRQVEYGSGGGITWDSAAAAEWEEVLIKTQSLATTPPLITPGSGLIETMGYEPPSAGAGGGVRNLGDHLARLSASAAYLGLPAPAAAEHIVEEVVAGMAIPARVRLVLRPDGTTEVDVTPLPPKRQIELLTLCVDRVPVASSDIGLFHKTTDRRRYDERTSRHRQADDVVLINERGEVTETTRANLAVCIDRRWWTPPLDCGLLPGVERARLIANGCLRERVITLDQLARVDAIATLSSLRGWRPARLRGVCVCASPTPESMSAHLSPQPLSP